MGKALSITSSELSQQHSVSNSSCRRPFKFSVSLKLISSIFFGKIHTSVIFSYEMVNKRSQIAIAQNQTYSLSMHGFKYN